MDVQELGSEEDPHRNDDDDGEFEEDFDVLVNEIVAPITQEDAPDPIINNAEPQMPMTPAANYLHDTQISRFQMLE